MNKKAIREKIKEKLSFFRGKIISDATEVEMALTSRLHYYFFPKGGSKSTIFYWNILNTNLFSFGKKISLYNKIPYFRKLNQDKEIKESLKFIQEKRNAVAHWELNEKDSNETRSIIENPTNLTPLRLDDYLIKEINKHKKFLLKKLKWE